MSPVEHELQTHAAALRRLARDLVGSTDADDLVQETALRALRSPPRAPGGLGAFLATILRRLAGTQRRDEQRRRRREQAAARPELVPGAEATLAHGEMLQRLTAALMALPQPYRDALLQRYFEGLRPSVMARRLDLPVATVKTRLQRGLQKLRDQFDAEHERSDWRPALAGTLGLGGWAGLTGVVVMGTGSKLLIGAAVLLAAAVAYFAWPAQPAASTASPVVSGTAPVAEDNAKGAVTPAPPRLERQEAGQAPVAAAVEPVRIRGRCIDAESKAPLPGCQVSVRATSRERTQPPPAEPLATGADGCLAFAFAPLAGFSITVECRAEGRLRRNAYLNELASAQVVDLGDIEMIAGARVHGRVVGPAGQALAGCHLALGGLPIAVRATGGGEKVRTRSKDDGTFSFEDPVPSGTWALDEASRRGWVQVSPRSVTVPSGAMAVEVVVTLASTPSISGRVVDDAGKPIAKVQVRQVLDSSGSYSVAVSEADGTFELFAIETDPPPVRLEVGKARGFELPPATEPVNWGTRDLRFVLQRGVDLDVEVVERVSQRPVEQFASTARKELGSSNAPQWPAARHAQGRTRLEGLERGRSIVAVMPDDPMLLPNQEKVDVQPGVRSVRIELERMDPRTVIVRDELGHPVAGALVEVLHLGRVPEQPHGPRDLRRAWPQIDEPKLTTGPWPVLYGKAQTDLSGEATVGLPADDDTLAVRVSCRGRMPVTVRQPRLLPGERLLVKLETGAVLDGSVRIAGYPPGRTFLVLTPTEDSDTMTRVEIAADGSFRVEGLEPGPRVVRLGMDFGGLHALEPPLQRVTLRPGERQALQLDASSMNAGTLQGRILVDGVGLSGARVRIGRTLISPGRRSGVSLGPFAADERGVFTAQGLLPGAFRLGLQIDEKHDLSIMHDEEVVVPAGGTVEREFHFTRRRLTVRVREPDGKPFAGRKLLAEWPEGFRLATTDGEGLATFDWMPAGTVTLRDRADDAKSTRRQPVEMVAARGETTVEVKWQ